VQCPEGRDGASFLAQYETQVNTLVYQQVRRYEGSISAEHGIGALKRDELAHYKSPVALDLMRRVKAALDPRGVMNPGRLLPP
jgi:FAD/FMN-containing dehydrogenase